MLKGYSNGQLAIGLIVGAAFAIFTIVWVIGLNYCPEAPCNYDYKHSHGPTDGPTQHQGWIPRPDLPNYTLQSEPVFTEGTPKEYEYADLQAQENMARATNWIVWVSLFSSAIAVAGVGLLISNLNVTREVGRDQSRAYIHADRANFFWGNEAQTSPRVEIWVRNTGQTPAKWYEIRIKELVYPHEGFDNKTPIFDQITLPDKFEGPWNAIPGDQEGNKATFFFKEDAERSDILKASQDKFGLSSPSHGFSVLGEIRYQTFFGETFISQFCFGRSILPARKVKEVRTIVVDSVTINDIIEEPIILARYSAKLKTYERID
jgi:hypothetical protein